MKDVSLILVALMIALYAALPRDYVIAHGLTCDSEWYIRFVYMFLHGSWAHVLINSYAFLSLVFISGANFKRFLIAFIIAAALPNIALSETPVIGFSAIIYALTGIMVMFSSKSWWFIVFNLLAIGATMTLAGIAFLVHLVCFCIGLGIGYLIVPRYEKDDNTNISRL